MFERLKPLGESELGYLISYVNTLRSKLYEIETKVNKSKEIKTLTDLCDELEKLRFEINQLRDQLYYLAHAVPKEVLKLSTLDVIEYCTQGKDILGIIRGAEKVFTVILSGLCGDLSLRIKSELENLHAQLKRVASTNVHPCVLNVWQDLLQSDFKDLESAKSLLLENPATDLGELCPFLLELQRIKQLVEKELPDRLTRYEEFRDRYLSPDKLISLIPEEAMKLFNSPEEIYEMFSTEFRQEAAGLVYVTGRERELEILLREVANCIFRLKGGRS